MAAQTSYKEWWLRRKDAPRQTEDSKHAGKLDLSYSGDGKIKPAYDSCKDRLAAHLAELEAEVDAFRMNQDLAKMGFNSQISANSTVSGGTATSCSLTELSSPEFFSRQCSEIDEKASKVVFESRIKDAFRAVVADCQFCVTIADPRDPEVPLIAVSDQFEAITGYNKAEIIGRSCSCLRLGCVSDPLDLLCLRAACKTGASFTSVLVNRRKTGEMFLNLLDLRGLTVAQNPWTGEELWFLVGIQADVTHVSDEQALKEHLPKLQEIAGTIRAKLVDELKMLAVAGALMTNFEGHAELERTYQDAWCICPEPTWKHGGHLKPLLSLSPLLVDPVLTSFGTPAYSWRQNLRQRMPQASESSWKEGTRWGSSLPWSEKKQDLLFEVMLTGTALAGALFMLVQHSKKAFATA